MILFTITYGRMERRNNIFKVFSNAIKKLWNSSLVLMTACIVYHKYRLFNFHQYTDKEFWQDIPKMLKQCLI
jgi:hypothetical protein